MCAPEQLTNERFDAALARVKADPTDAVAAEELILMHIMDRDDPHEARKYTFLCKDETLKLRVAQAAGDITTLSETEVYDLGIWYESLIPKASQDQARYRVYARAMMYLDRYLQIHAATDLTRTKATLVRDRVSERHAALRQALGIKDANPNAPLATLGSATPLPTTPERPIDPAILAWTRERDALPQTELIEALSKKLAEVNGGAPISIRKYDFNGNQLVFIMISEAPRLHNIDPLYGLKLNTLYLRDTAIEDLEALRGMPLERLGLAQCKSVKSLAPLQGMPLTALRLADNASLTGDLRALSGMTELRELLLEGCTQLECLRGIEKAQLEELSIEGCAPASKVT